MSEPGKLVERIDYTTGINGREGSAVVRRNRTEAETRAQFDRIYDNNIMSQAQLDRLSSAYFRTMRALDASGRSIPGMDNYGVARRIKRNNRRK